MSEQELTEIKTAFPDWEWDPITCTWDHVSRNSCIYCNERNQWILSTNDGLYTWSVKDPQQGMKEELLP